MNKKYDIKNRRIYDCWWNMRNRCDKGNRADSKYYHDKNITYCDDWKDYHAFQDWAINHGYSDNLTLDRIDSKKSYCPENCRWITIQQQQRNRSCCLYFTHDGETKTLSEWAKQYGINRTTLHDRIFKLGYSFEQAISTNGRMVAKTAILIVYNGEILNQSQFVKRFKTSHKRVNSLRSRGYTTEQIVDAVTRGGT